MCYSAQIQADYRKFVRMFGATMDIHEFARLFFERAEGVSKAKIPKAKEDAFAEPRTDAEREIKTSIDRFNAGQVTKLEQDLFKQRKTGRRGTDAADKDNQGCYREPANRHR
jgi:hypothetical protein